MTLQIRDHQNKICFNVTAKDKSAGLVKASSKLGLSDNLTVHKKCTSGCYKKI
jgi:hypothetical protein